MKIRFIMILDEVFLGPNGRSKKWEDNSVFFLYFGHVNIFFQEPIRKCEKREENKGIELELLG